MSAVAAVDFDPDMGATLAAAKQSLRSMMKQKLSTISPESINKQSTTIYNTLLTFPPYLTAKHISIFLSMPAAEVQTDLIVRHALSSGKNVFVPYLHRSPLASAGKTTPARVMDMVQLQSLADYEGLARDKWGIPSVDPAMVHERRRILGGPDAQHSHRATLDLVLMPGVAFGTEEGTGWVRRCGHGRGFYDFFVSRYAEKVAGLRDEAVEHSHIGENGESGEAQNVDGQVQGDDGESPSPDGLLLYGLGLEEQYVPPNEAAIPVGPLDRRLDGLILGDGTVYLPQQIN